MRYLLFFFRPKRGIIGVDALCQTWDHLPKQVPERYIEEPEYQDVAQVLDTWTAATHEANHRNPGLVNRWQFVGIQPDLDVEGRDTSHHRYSRD